MGERWGGFDTNLPNVFKEMDTVSFLTGSVGYAKVSLMALALQIKNIIRKEMGDRGISKRDLAKLLGCTEENVYQIMSDGKGMKTVIADKIFRVLGLEVVVEVKRNE